MHRLVLPLFALLSCSSPASNPDACAGPNACCYYWCHKPACDCVGGKAPNECDGANACCYYWCNKPGCSCTNYVRNPPPAPAPDMAVPDTEFEEAQ